MVTKIYILLVISTSVITDTIFIFSPSPIFHIQRLQRCGFKLSLLLLMLKLQDISSFIWRMCTGSSKTHHSKCYQKCWKGGRGVEIKVVHYDSLHSYLQTHRCLNKNAIHVQCIILASRFTLLPFNKRENTCHVASAVINNTATDNGGNLKEKRK